MEEYRTELENIKKILRSRPKGMSVTDISKKLGISRNTVAKYMEILRIGGHVDMENIGTAKIYCLSQRIPSSALLNFSADPIFVVDSNLHIIQANQTLLDIVDLKKDQIIGKWADYNTFPMASETGLSDKIKEAIEGKEYSGKIQVNVKNVERHYECKIVPSIFDDGEQGATLIFKDITESVNEHHILIKGHAHLEEIIHERMKELKMLNEELKSEILERKRAEELLQKERNLAQHYLDIASVIMVILDNEANCTLINKKGEALLGLDQDKIIGKNWLENFIPKRDRETVREFFNCVQKKSSGYPELHENHIICQNEEKLIRWSNVTLKNDNGQAIGVLSSGEDITEKVRNELLLKESEQRYRELFIDSPLANQLMTKEGILLDVNPAWAEMTGYSAEEAIGKSMDEFLVYEDISKFRAKLEFVDSDSINHADYSIVKKTGEIIIASFNCRYKNDQDEHKPTFHCIIKDVSEDRKMQIELQETNKQLEIIIESIQSGTLS